MKFMKSNPQVMLEMMSQPEERAAADEIQNQLYNSTSKQYLTSKGHLRYQNNEVLGGPGGRRVSPDSNKSPTERVGAGISYD